MKTYLEILEGLSKRTGWKLHTVFTKAGMSTSTYYRAKNGGDLRHETAMKVWRQFQLLQGAKALPHEKRKLNANLSSLQARNSCK
ncbi:MAG: hypothetical protein CXT67_09720 [Methanobacteriota archaeon]|nr:MAG: hypothetical protein CXT67_09720 [Euryarchaeota archaeon]